MFGPFAAVFFTTVQIAPSLARVDSPSLLQSRPDPTHLVFYILAFCYDKMSWAHLTHFLTDT